MARSSPHFVKVYLPELCSEYLKIPPAFRAHLGSESLGIVSLRGPSGNAWKVELVERSNGLHLDRGWRKFVTDHAIALGDILVFRLDECSCFSVLLFDETACQKKFAFLARPCNAGVDGHACGEKMADASRPCQPDIDTIIHVKKELVEEEETNEPRYVFLSPNDMLASVKKRKVCSTNGIGVQGPTSEETYLMNKRPRKMPDDRKVDDKIADRCSPTKSLRQNQKVVYPLKQSNESSECSRLLKSSEVLRRGEFLAKVQKMPSVTSQRQPVTKKEADKALHNSRFFKSNNPNFRVVMSDIHVYASFYVNVPSSFARRHLPKISQKITLWDENEQPWEVTYVYSHSCGSLSGGWGSFSLANNLEKSDVCVFELVRRNNLKVHTYRAIDKITPLIHNIKVEI